MSNATINEEIRATLVATLDRYCTARRPEYHPVTGALLPGAEAPCEFGSILCIRANGHHGDHRDDLGRTWPQNGGTK